MPRRQRWKSTRGERFPTRKSSVRGALAGLPAVPGQPRGNGCFCGRDTAGRGAAAGGAGGPGGQTGRRVELVPAPGMAGGRRGPGDPAGRRDGSVAGGTPERTGIPGVSSCGAQRRYALSSRVPAARPLRVHLDLAGLPALKFYRVEIVDSSGAPVFEAVSARGEGDLVVETTKPLAAAGYWVRLYEPGPAELCCGSSACGSTEAWLAVFLPRLAAPVRQLLCDPSYRGGRSAYRAGLGGGPGCDGCSSGVSSTATTARRP